MPSHLLRSAWNTILFPCLLVSIAFLTPLPTSFAQTIWVEGESPASDGMHRHGWYDSVDKSQLSGEDFISNFSNQVGQATYKFQATDAGQYQLWMRINPVATKLELKLNNKSISVDASKAQQNQNIAADNKPDLRFIAWVDVGSVDLKKGQNVLDVRMVSDNNNHGSLDCFVLSKDGFQPNGKLKPGQKLQVDPVEGWFAFQPDTDTFDSNSAIDLRSLNEAEAGQNGRIVARDGKFWHSDNNQPVRFWAVNGPPHQLTGAALERCARRLAKYGVNMVRVHHAVFDQNGNPDLANVQHCHEIVKAMKAEGIYVHFSVYFPLWWKPKGNLPGMDGYDGSQNPFGSLFFNREFQKRYVKWVDTLLLTPGPDGKKLIDEPAVFGVELVNEDSLFFWTFGKERIPAAQFQLIEQAFGSWLKKKYGSPQAALKAWNSQPIDGDQPAAGRMTIRPLWNLANDRTPRDQDTAAFLAEVQYRFYKQVKQHLTQIGFQGLVTCSNWHTASPEFLDPLERLSYTAGDFIDRHGYFSGIHQGDASSYSIRNGQTFSHRSALRFDSAEPGKPKDFTHPAMDLHYNSMPSMISETTFNRLNRYRSEGPLYFATYGALQDSNAIVHFAFNGTAWEVQPGGGMDPWSIATPAMLGQFPAAALLYRQGLVESPAPVANIQLNIDDAKQLKGTPLPQGASFDQLRAADLPKNVSPKGDSRLDPLLHLVGPTVLNFTSDPTNVQLESTDRIDRSSNRVTSANNQLRLDYENGLLIIDAPKAQGASGNLASGGTIETSDLQLQSEADLQHVVIVALDDQPIGASRKMLLQVMTEEMPTDFTVQPVGDGKFQIQSAGVDPWQVKNATGLIRFRDGQRRTITVLDANGLPTGQPSQASEIQLQPDVLYYLIEKN